MKKMIEQDSSPKSATGTLYSKYKPVILACIAFLLPAFLVSTVIYQRYQVVITDKKHQAYEALSTAFERMQHTISYGHSAAKTLSFFIDDNGRVNNFDSIIILMPYNWYRAE